MTSKTKVLIAGLSLFSLFAWMQIKSAPPTTPFVGYRGYDKGVKVFQTVRQGGSTTYTSSNYSSGSYSSSSSSSGGSYSYGK